MDSVVHCIDKMNYFVSWRWLAEMRKSSKEKQKKIDQAINELEKGKSELDKELGLISEYLKGVGNTRRIKPCDTEDPTEDDCPWNQSGLT